MACYLRQGLGFSAPLVLLIILAFATSGVDGDESLFMMCARVRATQNYTGSCCDPALSGMAASYSADELKQCHALVELMCQVEFVWEATGTWTRHDGWHDSAMECNVHYCQWFGITCNETSKYVTHISLPNNGLEGYLRPARWAALSKLQFINFAPTEQFNEASWIVDTPDNSNRIFHIDAGLCETVYFPNLTILAFDGTEAPLPSDILDCEDLLGLYWRGNSLTQLPDPIAFASHFHSLQFLSLSYNSISVFPYMFDNPCLTQFLFDHNALASVEFVGDLSSVTYLDISHNVLTSLPASILNLHNLIHLRMTHNQIGPELPSGFVQNLSNLGMLLMAHNLFERLPEDIGSLPLVNFTVYQNELVQIPESFGDLSSLQRTDVGLVLEGLGTGGMFLHMNRLTSLPLGLRKLTRFQMLVLTSNNMTALPVDVLNNSQWCYVSINLNPIRRLDASSKFTTGCTSQFGFELRADYCEIEHVDDDFFDSLTDLRMIDLGNNRLTKLPRSMVESKKLRTLFLGYNMLTELPEDFGDHFESLCKLTLHENQLVSLPDSFSKLDSLVFVMLTRNKLRELPEEFGNIMAHDLDLHNPCRYARNDTACVNGTGQCYNTSASALSLSLDFNELQRLPNSLDDAIPARLAYLDVGFNQLTHIPALASGFADLALYLGWNNLSTLPDHFLANATLFELDLTHNRLSSVPMSVIEAVARSTSMRMLAIAENQLVELPLYFGASCPLRTLDLHENHLITASAQLEVCYNLEYVDLSQNNFQTIPSFLLNSKRSMVGAASGFAHLREVRLGGNRIQSFYSQDAWEFTIAIQLSMFPMDQLLALEEPGIRILNMSDNGIFGMVTVLGGLERFYVAHNNLTLLTIDATYLNDLDVSNNVQMTYFPQFIVGWAQYIFAQKVSHGYGVQPNLRQLRMSGTAITQSLSSWFCEDVRNYVMTSGLQLLDISSNNFLGGIPDCFSRLRLTNFFADNMGAAFRDNSVINPTTSTVSSRLDVAASGPGDGVERAILPPWDYSTAHLDRHEGVPMRMPVGLRTGLRTDSRFRLKAAPRASLAATGGVTSDFYKYSLANNVGLNPAVLSYSGDFVGYPELKYSCAAVLLVADNRTRVELDPAYFNYAGCRCDMNFYGDPGRGIACRPCDMVGAVCPVPGLVHPLPMPGWWTASTPPFSPARCRPTKGGSGTPCANVADGFSTGGFYESLVDVHKRYVDTAHVEMWCDEGYKGTLCAQCADRFYTSGIKCKSCPPARGFFAFLNISLFGMWFVVLYYFAIKDTGKWNAMRESQPFVKVRAARHVLGRRLPAAMAPSLLAARGRSWVIAQLRHSERANPALLVGCGDGGGDADGTGSDDEGRDEGVCDAVDDAADLARVATVAEFFTDDEDTRQGAGSSGERVVIGVATLVLHFQMFNLLSSISGAMFESTDSVSTEGFSFTNMRLGNAECYFQGYRFFEKFMVALSMPWLYGLLVFHLFWLSFVAYMLPWVARAVARPLVAALRGRFSPLREAWALIVARAVLWKFWVFRHAYALLFLYWNSYMSITPLVFQGLRCQQYEHTDPDESFKYLMVAPYIRCSASEWRYVVILTFSIIYLLFWVIGLPAVLLTLIVTESRIGGFLFKMYRLPSQSSLDSLRDVRDFLTPAFVRRRLLGPEGRDTQLRAHFFKYWELWKLALRLFVSMVIALLDIQSAFIPFLLIFLFGLAAALQLIFRPFIEVYPGKRERKTFANELELSSLILTIFNFCMALVCKIPATSNLVAVGVFTVILNMLFLVVGIGIVLRSPSFSYPVRKAVTRCRQGVDLWRTLMRRLKSAPGDDAAGCGDGEELDTQSAVQDDPVAELQYTAAPSSDGASSVDGEAALVVSPTSADALLS